MNAIDAAANVLGESKEPLNTPQRVEQVSAKKYWTNPGGNGVSFTSVSPCLKQTRLLEPLTMVRLRQAVESNATHDLAIADIAFFGSDQ